MNIDVSLLAQGFANAFSLANMAAILAGLVVGIIGGMLPGITVVTAIALFIPFTFTLPPATALIALGAVYCGATYGGANAAILINTPGQPGSIATVMDGYPMTLKGKAEKALYVALISSCFGGVVGSMLLLLFFEPLSAIALKFGSEAFFWMAIFGLTTLAAMSPGNIIRSLLAGGIGLALSTIGLDPSTGFPRFTFGFAPLVQGLDMVVLMIGLFSISQMLLLLESHEAYIAEYSRDKNAFKEAFRELFGKNKALLASCSTLGTVIGTLPGAGGSVAAIIAYNEAKRWSKKSAEYGTGIVEGLAAPESANNGSVGGALVPLMSLGIPGSAAAAVLMGGLLAQGLTPGPQLLSNSADVAYTFITGLIIVNVAMLVPGYVLARVCARILSVPKLFIIPGVIGLSFIGSYALRNSLFDAQVMFLSGFVAYLLMKAKIPPASIALGVVLGPIIEESLTTTLMRGRADDSVYDLLIFSPFSMSFILLSILALSVPPVMQHFRKADGTPSACRQCAFSLSKLWNYRNLTVLVVMLAGIFFYGQSLELSFNAGLFPKVVYGLIILLCLVCLLDAAFFDPLPADPGTARESFAQYRTVAVAVFVSGLCFASVPVAGFFGAICLCMAALLCALWPSFRSSVPKGRDVLVIAAFSLGVTLALYLCFTAALGVHAPGPFWSES